MDTYTNKETKLKWNALTIPSTQQKSILSHNSLRFKQPLNSFPFPPRDNSPPCHWHPSYAYRRPAPHWRPAAAPSNTCCGPWAWPATRWNWGACRKTSSRWLHPWVSSACRPVPRWWRFPRKCPTSWWLSRARRRQRCQRSPPKSCNLWSRVGYELIKKWNHRNRMYMNMILKVIKL